jgi:hypothetical protein
MASPESATRLRLLPGCACLSVPSRGASRRRWRCTSGARGVATRGLCPIAWPGWPAQDVPAADARCGRRGAMAAWTRGRARRRTHQEMVPSRSSAWAPAGRVAGFLVMRDQGEVGARAGGVLVSADATPLHPLTGCPSLCPPSPPRTPLGSSDDALASGEEKCRLPTFRLRVTGWVRDDLFAGGCLVGARSRGSAYTTPLPLWCKAFSTFAVLVLTTFLGRAPLLPLPPHSSARPPCCWQSQPLRTVWRPCCCLRLPCPGASYPGRVPVAQHWVVS